MCTIKRWLAAPLACATPLAGADLAGSGGCAITLSRPRSRLDLTRNQARQGGAQTHEMCSGSKLLGYRIEAADGAIGRVEELLIVDADWSIADMLVDTRDLLPGGNVLVAPSAVEAIDSVRPPSRSGSVRYHVVVARRRLSVT